MTGSISMDRLSRLADTLRKVDDADARLLGKLIEGLVRVMEDDGRSDEIRQLDTPATAVPVVRSDPFDRPDMHPLLAAVASRLRVRLGDDKCATWIMKLSFVGEKADTVTLTAPNKFTADYVNDQFGVPLLDEWQAEQPSVVRVVVRPPA
ncbi:DnaA N-terminal domain-containing protein [Tardiphaga sp. 1201_B9_N1_1]|uniref:DnaA N-terminal domain-containing protein n=1 Tax=unclassified Tardiphaga TaxID=2631404 RepID=UPI003F251E20